MTTASREPRWLDEAQQRSWRALVIGTTLLMDRLDDDLRRSFNISLTEYEILVRLSERPGRCMRMAQLADALAHSRSRVTHTVDRMEKAGYVVRGTTPEDGRGIVATMTDKGFALLAGGRPPPRRGRALLPRRRRRRRPTSSPSAGSWTPSPTSLIAGHPEMEIR